MSAGNWVWRGVESGVDTIAKAWMRRRRPGEASLNWNVLLPDSEFRRKRRQAAALQNGLG